MVVTLADSNFNSNMVRLKDMREYRAPSCLCYFNSNMVRLKAPTAVFVSASNTHFNSNMVRLKGFFRALLDYGILISIPIWFD